MKRLLKFERFRRARFPGARLARAEDSLRALADHAPQAEALAASCIERVRPLAERIYGLRRRIATTAIVLATGLLFVHVMFGANGMVVFKQKRAEYGSLQKKIVQVDQENERYTQQIDALKSDEKAVEKEAREQLGYVKPGEYKYVSSAPAAPPAQHNTNTTKK